jgi:hypothetical protein
MFFLSAALRVSKDWFSRLSKKSIAGFAQSSIIFLYSQLTTITSLQQA